MIDAPSNHRRLDPLHCTRSDPAFWRGLEGTPFRLRTAGSRNRRLSPRIWHSLSGYPGDTRKSERADAGGLARPAESRRRSAGRAAAEIAAGHSFTCRSLLSADGFLPNQSNRSRPFWSSNQTASLGSLRSMISIKCFLAISIAEVRDPAI
jgi:hypothetical protein